MYQQRLLNCRDYFRYQQKMFDNHPCSHTSFCLRVHCTLNFLCLECSRRLRSSIPPTRRASGHSFNKRRAVDCVMPVGNMTCPRNATHVSCNARMSKLRQILHFFNKVSFHLPINTQVMITWIVTWTMMILLVLFLVLGRGCRCCHIYQSNQTGRKPRVKPVNVDSS